MAYLEYRPQSPLYHYSTPGGFVGILSSKQLWLSDLRSTNDPREIQFGFEKFLRAMDEIRNQEADPSRKRVYSIMEERLTRYWQNTTGYCCCFSLVRDELPMWREYGDSLGGLAIGFRPTAINGIPGRVQKATYLETSSPGAFKSVIEGIVGEVIRKRLGPLDQVALGSEIAAAIIATKHSSWAYEQEVRIVHMQTGRDARGVWDMPTAQLPDGRLVNWTEPLTRRGKRGEIKYKAFSYGRYRDGAYNPSRAIREVILGPHFERSEDYVTHLMHEHGFADFSVTRSECLVK